jgi:hypothetical protein
MMKKAIRKFFKGIAVFFVLFLLVLVLLHFWLLQNARAIVAELVVQQSEGRQTVGFKKLSIDYRNLKIQVHNFDFHPVDSMSSTATFRFSSERLSLQVKSLWSLVFHKKVDVDSIVCTRPIVEIYKQDNSGGKKLSLSNEVGNAYLMIQQAVNGLRLKRFQIDDGTFRVIDRTNESKPIQISDIWLAIDNLRIDTGKINDQPFLFSDNIDFRTSNQDISWGEDDRRLKFKRLHLNTKSAFLETDSCFMTVARKDSSGSSFAVLFDKLRLVNPNLKALYLDGAISADSIYCERPLLRMEINVKNKTKKRRGADKSFEHALNRLAGDLLIKNIDVKNADISITMKKENTIRTFQAVNNSFSFSDIALRQNEEDPVYIGHINLSIRNYLTYSTDSAYCMQFDSISFLNNKVRISNLALSSYSTAIKKRTTSVKIPFVEMSNVEWAELLFNKRIVANKAVLFSPQIDIESDKQQSAHRSSSVLEVLEHVSQVIELEHFRMINGTVDYKTKGGLRLYLQGVNAAINTDMLLNAQNRKAIQNAVSMFNFDNAIVVSRNAELKIKDGYFDGAYESLDMGELELINKQGTLEVYAENVHLHEILSDNSLLQAEGVSWDTANIKIKLLSQKDEKRKRKLLLDLKDIQGRNTSVTLVTATSTISTQLDHLNIPIFQNADGMDIGKGTYLEGKDFVMEGPTNINCRSYSIKGGGHSVLSDLRVERYSDEDSLNAIAAKLEFVPHTREISMGNIELVEMSITNPVIKLVKKHKDNQVVQEEKYKPIPKLNIGQVRVINPIVHIDIQNQRNKNEIFIPVPSSNSPSTLIQLGSIHSHEDGTLSIGEILLRIEEFKIANDSTTILCRREGNLDLQLINTSFKPGTANSKASWKGMIKSISGNYLLFDQRKTNKKVYLVLKKAEIDSLSLDIAKLKPYEILKESPHLIVKNFSGSLKTSATDMSWQNVKYDKFRRVITLDTLDYCPTISRDSFVSLAQFEPTYIQGKFHNLTIHNVDLTSYFRDSVLRLNKLTVNEPQLTIYKDKTVPFDPGNIKPLPVNLIKSIPFALTLDTLVLSNGVVKYVERSRKTKLEGSVFLTRLNATIYPVTNQNLKDADSLNIRAQAYLMDTALIRLRMRESYTDSLAGFVMTVQMPPANLTILNSITIPLGSLKLKSVLLDTLHMRVAASEYMSIGTMTMHYRKLKIQYLKGGKEAKQNLLSGFATFAANSIVKTNNRNRTGKVFYVRNRHRRVVNYWVNMSMSGVATSVGVKHNKKYEREYQKQLKLQNLPSIDF